MKHGDRMSAPNLPASASVVVIGGGIAGLSAAWQLGVLGVRDVVLVEAESMLGSHSSARNAAIFLPLEESLSAVWLAQRSRDLLDTQLGTGWLSAQGVTLVAGGEDPLDELRFAARRFGVFHERWGPATLDHRLPMLTEGDARYALHLPLGGVMDVHMVMMALSRFIRKLGIPILTSTRVESFDVSGQGIQAVRLEGGRSIKCERIVMAAGAWAGRLGLLAGADLTLSPLRRHLVQLVGEEMPRWRTPTVWRVDDGVYFRPEAGGVLASPCDEVLCEPGVPGTDPGELEALAMKLARLAPSLGDAQVQRSWACLRTMSTDREMIVGEDPRLKGVFWLAGLGGRGMTCGVAAGELLARLMVGLPHPLTRTLGVQRLL